MLFSDWSFIFAFPQHLYLFARREKAVPSEGLSVLSVVDSARSLCHNMTTSNFTPSMTHLRKMRRRQRGQHIGLDRGQYMTHRLMENLYRHWGSERLNTSSIIQDMKEAGGKWWFAKIKWLLVTQITSLTAELNYLYFYIGWYWDMQVCRKWFMWK